jgi:hypothetical protein
MNRLGFWVFLLLFISAALPAHAYGDPSGGTLFQVLMPALAALWATWMIFANRVRATLTNVYRKLRGGVSQEPPV